MNDNSQDLIWDDSPEDTWSAPKSPEYNAASNDQNASPDDSPRRHVDVPQKNRQDNSWDPNRHDQRDGRRSTYGKAPRRFNMQRDRNRPPQFRSKQYYPRTRGKLYNLFKNELEHVKYNNPDRFELIRQKVEEIENWSQCPNVDELMWAAGSDQGICLFAAAVLYTDMGRHMIGGRNRY